MDSDGIIDLTRRLVAIPTVEHQRAAQELIAVELDAAGFTCDLAPDPAPTLIARRGTGGRFLCSHVDVHPPHAHPDPWTCREVDGALVGRGALDAKGQIAALLAACRATTGPAVVVITADEETTGRGSERLALEDGPWRDEGGIVLEPTDMVACTAQQGHIDVRLTVDDVPAHAYAPPPDEPAADRLLAAVAALRRVPPVPAHHPRLPEPRVHVGPVDTGKHLWRREGHVSAEVSVGLLPGTDPEQAAERFRAAISDLDVRLTVIDASPGTEIPEDLPVVRRLLTLTGSGEPGGMPSWTDAGNLWTHHGIPCAVIGAGDLALAHSDHESVPIAGLGRLAEVLAQTLDG